MGVGHLKVMSEGCSVHSGKNLPLAPLGHGVDIKGPLLVWNSWSFAYSMLNFCGICVEMWKSQLLYLSCGLDICRCDAVYMDGSVTQEVMAVLWQNGLAESILFQLKQHRKWPTCSSTESSSTFSTHQAWNEGLLLRSWTGIEKVLVSSSEISTHYHSICQRRDLHWFSDTIAYEWTEYQTTDRWLK